MQLNQVILKLVMSRQQEKNEGIQEDNRKYYKKGIKWAPLASK